MCACLCAFKLKDDHFDSSRTASMHTGTHILSHKILSSKILKYPYRKDYQTIWNVLIYICLVSMVKEFGKFFCRCKL